ncbi:ferredoxin-type protein [gut metagenome]|uniref:Ferredoxin-type protein n=1 Tax=gut metagenome TaxID=749906 RepID=J9GZM0_9ZZZZ
MGGAIGILIFQFALALLFGRIYCSTICPAGVLQDIINRIFCIGKKKKNGTRRFSYHKPMNILRYSILGLTAILAFFGIIELITLLDPYSNFGRIANNLIRPVVMWGNNILANGLALIDNYSLYQVTISNVTTFGVISGAVALILFILMVSMRGRLFCNTICPVGAMLSLLVTPLGFPHNIR